MKSRHLSAVIVVVIGAIAVVYIVCDAARFSANANASRTATIQAEKTERTKQRSKIFPWVGKRDQ